MKHLRENIHFPCFQHLLIACFLSNISAKYYENPTMLPRIIAKNIRDVFFFETQCIAVLLAKHHSPSAAYQWLKCKIRGGGMIHLGLGP